MEKNYILIHGSFVDSTADWYPWIVESLKKQGNEVIAPNFPIGLGNQNYENWKNELDKYKDKINENTVFIAHSIGPIFVVKYILENNLHIDSLYSVSGFNGFINIKDFDEVNKTFFLNEIVGFEKLCRNRICFLSKNDPFVPYYLLDMFTKNIYGDIKLIEDGGHFIKESGYTTFPELLDSLKK